MIQTVEIVRARSPLSRSRIFAIFSIDDPLRFVCIERLEHIQNGFVTRFDIMKLIINLSLFITSAKGVNKDLSVFKNLEVYLSLLAIPDNSVVRVVEFEAVVRFILDQFLNVDFES